MPCCPFDLTSCYLDVLLNTVLQTYVLHIVVVHLMVLCFVAYHSAIYCPAIREIQTIYCV
jgi:hypothetical protein